MSHSTVLVVLPREPEDHNDLDELLSNLLAPFDENEEVDEYRDYVKLDPEWRTKPWVELNYPYSSGDLLVRRPEHPPRRLDPGYFDEAWDTYRAIPAGELTDVDFEDGAAVLAALGDTEYLLDEDGRRIYSLSTYNPNSRWDWWSLGGRWMGDLLRKDTSAKFFSGSPGVGGNVNQELGADCLARGNFDDEGYLAREIRQREAWYREYEAAVRAGDNSAKFRWGVQEDDTRESYVSRVSAFRTFAVLAEGVWKEPGRMGWWGFDSSTDQSQLDYSDWFVTFWTSMPPNVWVAVVDVHI